MTSSETSVALENAAVATASQTDRPSTSFTYVPYSGRVELDTVDLSKIDIRDVAFMLSRKRRFNSASDITVGIHNLCCRNRSKRLGHSPMRQLEHLLHDGSETYLTDLTRPMKRRWPWYLTIEAMWESAVFKMLGVSTLEGYREIDDWMLATEIAHQFKDNLDQWTVKPIFDTEQFAEYDRYLCYTDRAVEAEFLNTYHQLRAEIANVAYEGPGYDYTLDRAALQRKGADWSTPYGAK